MTLLMKKKMFFRSEAVPPFMTNREGIKKGEELGTGVNSRKLFKEV